LVEGRVLSQSLRVPFPFPFPQQVRLFSPAAVQLPQAQPFVEQLKYAIGSSFYRISY
jgi:hypothetical protein